MAWNELNKEDSLAILGLGQEGIAAYNWVRQRYLNQPITIIDRNSESLANPLFDSDENLTRLDENQARLDDYSLIIKSPGISLYREDIQKAVAVGSRITSGTRIWFAENPGRKSIIITGSKGKSTTTSLLQHLCQAVGIASVAAGNLGTPLLDLPDNDDWVLAELSSYQLADLNANPVAAVCLNLFPEHLDWHGSLQQYYADKLQLFKKINCPRILNADDAELMNELGHKAEDITFGQGGQYGWNETHFTRGSENLLPLSSLRLPGLHNRRNCAATLAVIDYLGADTRQLCEALASFKALPHRFEDLGKHGQWRFINDSISTTPVSTLAALEALAGQDITVLVGGYDRGLDWTIFYQQLQTHPHWQVITMPDSGGRIYREISEQHPQLIKLCHQSTSLEDAVRRAKEITPQNGIILLSPGAPAYGKFRDHRERGERFMKTIDSGI